MFKPIIKMTAATVIAGLFAGLFVFATVAASTADVPDNTSALPQAAAKGDRLPLHVKGAACSLHGWPDFERKCQFDLRRVDNEAQKVRVIALR
jgi:hypothetical protein